MYVILKKGPKGRAMTVNEYKVYEYLLYLFLLKLSKKITLKMLLDFVRVERIGFWVETNVRLQPRLLSSPCG